MEILYIVTAILFIIRPEASAQAADLACSALKNVVIKSLFPMMVLSRLIAYSKAMLWVTGRLTRLGVWKRLKLSDSLLPCILTGLLSGLPASAREIQRLRAAGEINGQEAKKALALSSVPSPAFVILVASDGLRQGIFRYVILLLSAYVASSLFRSEKSRGTCKQMKMTFSTAITSSASSAITVSASIVFFSAVICLIASVFPKAEQISAAFFEMGSGVIFAKGNGLLISAALGWCGLSAASQIRSEAGDVEIDAYFVAKAVSCVLLLLFEIVQKNI